MKKGMIFIDGSNVFFDWGKSNPSKNMDIEKYIEYKSPCIEEIYKICGLK